MAVQLDPARARTPARSAARRRTEPHTSQAGPVVGASERPAPVDPPAKADPGIAAFIVFVAAVLLVVVAVVVAGAVDRWWVLGPVMLADFGVVFAVIGTINRLLGDGDDGTA